MGWLNLLPVVLLSLAAAESDYKDVKKRFCYHSRTSNASIYDYQLQDVHKQRPIDWSEYKGKQEPGRNGTEIYNGLRYVRPGGGFVPNFELTEKVEVNGPNEHPLFTYIKSFCPSPWKSYAPVKRLNYEGLSQNDIRWNFEKFLIDREGHPVMRYSETYLPLDIQSDIQQLLMM